MRIALRGTALGLALCGTAGAALAQEFAGVYVSTRTACEWLADEGRAAFETHDFLALVPGEGIIGYQYACHFFDVHTRQSAEVQSVVAACETPEYAFPDQLAIRPRGADTLEVTSLFEALLTANDPVSTGGTRLYYACDNLEGLPLD